jgi:lysophospholipase L1-like esterase
MKPNGKWLAVVCLAVILFGVFVAIYFNIPRNVVRVACAGDSITEGTEYPHDLALLLGANYSVGNFGVGGSTVSLQSDKPYMNQTKFQSLKDFSPNIVVIMLGTNDAYPSRQQSLDSFKSDYGKLIASFQTLSTKPKIYILLPPPIFNDSLGPNNAILAQNVIPLIRQVANETGLPLVDTNTPLLGRVNDFWDGVHPNNEGAKILATQIYNAIR